VEDGEGHTTLVSDPRLLQSWTGILPFVWSQDSRLIYGRTEEGLSSHTSNIWAIDTDVEEGEARGAPFRLTQLAAFNVRGLSITADGRQMAALLVQNQADVYLGAFDERGTALTQVSQVTFDGRDDYPNGWMPDSERLLFRSERTGQSAVFGWDFSTRSIKLLYEGPAWHPVASADGSCILACTPRGIVRIPAEGGPSDLFAEAADAVQCVSAMHPECVVGRFDGGQYVLSFVNLDTRQSREGARFPHRAPFTNWAVSPDGSRVAVVHNDDNVVTLINLSTGEQELLEVDGWKYFEFLSWSADGKRIYLNAGTSGVVDAESRGLISLGLDGQVAVLRADPHEWPTFPTASPDGRYLAYASMRFHGNVFLVRDF
jgi:dipeptidyl aminopeptidase/acylaminoacyl peptidase